uniref:Uncharacterized protein n=1 Tax=Syphacia muris TaxID=451379 RepID=A0A0N5AIN0_9BILA
MQAHRFFIPSLTYIALYPSIIALDIIDIGFVNNIRIYRRINACKRVGRLKGGQTCRSVLNEGGIELKLANVMFARTHDSDERAWMEERDEQSAEVEKSILFTRLIYLSVYR